MIRTQIQLTAEQSKRLKAAAARKKISMAELIRRGVEVILEQELEPSSDECIARALAAAGRFRSGHPDVARRHDEYLGQAYSSSSS